MLILLMLPQLDVAFDVPKLWIRGGRATLDWMTTVYTITKQQK
jgi:hypothetical protein